MGRIFAERYHDFSTGHRVHNHESKCAHLHGHNYRIHFKVEALELDEVGRVVDFSVIKTTLCNWLEDNWDHKFLVWKHDPMAFTLSQLDPEGVVQVPFNPTAENMAKFLLEVVGPAQLDAGLKLVEVRIEETRKCSASYEV
ncbi:MAG: 6-carboxytetrahydropterin synthase [Planctomycetota bacterium]